MSFKAIDGFGFQGTPKMLYADNKPFSKSRVFLNVMEYLGVQVATHLPAGSDSRRVTARAKGKVERPFRTIKEAQAGTRSPNKWHSFTEQMALVHRTNGTRSPNKWHSFAKMEQKS